MNPKFTPVSQDEAERRGMTLIAGPYRFHEVELLERAVRQLGRIPCVIVDSGEFEFSLWRARKGMKEVRGE